MFTGIIKEVGEVEGLDRDGVGARLRVRAALAADLGEGDSVAVSGPCLTVAAVANGAFEADVMNQTLALTTLGGMAPGARVNLEPPLRTGDPLGGHIVQGHIDGTGEVAVARDDGFARRVRIVMPPELRPYVVEHGSLAVDGVSLTVAALTDDGCEVSLIPETLERTTLAQLAARDPVNLEVDLIARYAERLMRGFTVSEGKGDG
jgi:riboflavin synthase